MRATLFGVIWGLMRRISDSVLVSSVAHAVWNAMLYPLFGFGEEIGALGVRQTGVYGPEIGWVGPAASMVFALVLWRRTAAARSPASS